MKKIIIYLIYNIVCLNITFGQPIEVKNRHNSSVAHIKVVSDSKVQSDSVILRYRDNQWGEVAGIPSKIVVAKLGEELQLEFKNDEPFLYASLSLGKTNYIFYTSIIEPLDNVEFSMTKQGVSITGNGKEKYQFVLEVEKEIIMWTRSRTDSLVKLNEKYGVNYNVFNDHKIESYIKAINDGADFKNGKREVVLRVLEKYKTKLSSKIYQILRLDYLSRLEYDSARGFTFFTLTAGGKDKKFADSCINIISKIYNADKIDNAVGLESNVLSGSNWYFRYILEQIKMLKYDPQATVSFITCNYSNSLRDRLLTIYLIKRSIRSDEDVSLVSTALKSMNTKYCSEMLNEFLNNSAPGTTAFEFSLTDTLGNIIKQSDFNGKVVFLDFFYTGCTYCKILNDKMSSIFEMYKDNKNIKFLSVSIDKNILEWKNSVRSLQYTHKGSIDLFTNGQGKNAQIIKHYNIGAYPKMIIIDKKGKVVSANPPEPHDDERRAELIQMINSAL